MATIAGKNGVVNKGKYVLLEALINPKYLCGGNKLSAMQELHKFCVSTVPFITGNYVNNRTVKPRINICRAVICMSLKVSRRYVYKITGSLTEKVEESSLVESIFEQAGKGMMQM